MSPSTTHPVLVAAKQVVAEIVALGIAASNRESSKLALGQAALDQRFTALNAGHMQANEGGLNTFAMGDAPSVLAAAQLVAQHRAGNCQEQAALALDKLARRNVRPLEIMDILNQDHTLVVAGRLAGNPLASEGWNSDTVICDPWAKRAYFVHALADEMALIRSVTSGETKMIQKFRLGAGARWP
jgi:hypothetical protein